MRGFLYDAIMAQLVFIHGGDSFESREAYLNDLRTRDIDPFKEKEERWHRNFPETLGETWEIIRPSMPGENCDYEEWSIWFERHIPFMKDGVVLVGHSLGANFLVAYLSKHTLPVGIRQLHLVGGCAGTGTFPFPEDGSHIENQAKQIFLYHSTDDPVVPYTDALKYKELLPSATLSTFEDRGHFLQAEFPELIERITHA